MFSHCTHALQQAGTLGMGVLDGYRGLGVGERLLRRTLAHALEKGIYRVTLEARSDNTRVIRLDERVGFRQEGIARAALRFAGRFHDAVQMTLLQGPAAKRLADRQRKKTVGEVISSLARQVLSGHARGAQTQRNGIPLLPRRKDASPVTLEWVNQLS